MSSTRITATQSSQLRPSARRVIASAPSRMTSAFEGWNVPTLGAGRAVVSVTGMPPASNSSGVSLPLPGTGLLFSEKSLCITAIFRGSELRDHARPLPVGPEPLTSSLASPPSSVGQHVAEFLVKGPSRNPQQPADLHARDLAARDQVIGGVPTNPQHFRDFTDGVADGAAPLASKPALNITGASRGDRHRRSPLVVW